MQNKKPKQPIEFYYRINFSFFVIFNIKKVFLPADHFLGDTNRKNAKSNGVFKMQKC